jgi:hypothetical protein
MPLKPVREVRKARRNMPTFRLCRVGIVGGLVWLRGNGLVRAEVGISEAVEEGEESVGWAVATVSRGAVWCGSVECLFFDGEVGVEVDLG